MPEKDKFILVLGCFDTKGDDFSFLRDCILAHGEKVITVNTGIMGTTNAFPVDFESDRVASEAGYNIIELRHAKDRGKAVEAMGFGVAKLTAQLMAEGHIKAAIGMGGGGGTHIVLCAMQQIPLGIPKFCLSTIAAKDLSAQMGNKDITLMPSIVDIAGLNSVSRLLMQQAAAAICAMSNIKNTKETTTSRRIAISMFGNTSACVDQCSTLLSNRGFEVMAFHANGVGGRTMESMIRERWFDAVLDVTTTELADELCGGVCSAGPDRLNAAAELGIPQVVVPGCLDMVNWGHIDTVPDRYQNRDLYKWAPHVTLMRTNEVENEILGERLVNKLKNASAPVAIVLPKQGISQIDAKDGVFWRPEINQLLFETIKNTAKGTIDVMEADHHINDRQFAEKIVGILLDLVEKHALAKMNRQNQTD
ncbi:MAG: Tm-1-like ATP-binding domain-containing protein [Sphingobacteriaceae bacterium]